MLSELPDNDDRRAATSGAFAGRAARRIHRRRRGFSVVWLIVWVPLLLTLSCLVIDVANVWLSRVELESGLEAAALAAVQEWAEGSGSDTELARKVGVAYACQNKVRGCPTVIGTNYNAAGDVNQNDECCIGPGDLPGDPPKGNLIFGAIDDSNTAKPVTFDSRLEPGCGGEGFLLFDVTGGSLQTAHNNEWGVAFIKTANTPADLRVKTIIIDLRANGGSGFFIPQNNPAPELSDLDPTTRKVRHTGCPGNIPGENQPDLEGFPDWVPDGSAGQIQFTLLPATGPPYTQLRIDFSAARAGFPADDGFAPCDRFRFGIDTDDVSSGTGKNDPDGIGRDGVGITVVFQQGASPPFTRTGRYYDTLERWPAACWSRYATCNPPGDLIVSEAVVPQFPGGIPNLPFPHSSSAKNNGQSWTLLGAGGGRPFAVRAQARMVVPTLWRHLFGCWIGPHCITVKTTAMYDCDSGRPHLVKLDDYICVDPTP